MRSPLRFILWGTAFGFMLSRAQATDYDAIAGMFAGTNLHLLLVIGGAIAVGAVSYRVVARWRSRTLRPTDLGTPAPITLRGTVGAAIFGLGWGLAGTCPGTGFAQLGEGKLLAFFTVAGMLLGTLLQARVAARLAAARAPTGEPAVPGSLPVSG